MMLSVCEQARVLMRRIVNDASKYSCIQCSSLTSKTQGCALTEPRRLRRLTFGFGQVRKITQSPSRALWLIVFLADKAAKNF